MLKQYEAAMKQLRDSPAIERIRTKASNHLLADLINDYAQKERLRTIDLIERLEIGGCEGPEIGYALALVRLMQLKILVNSTIQSGFPEIGLLIANSIDTHGTRLGLEAVEAMIANTTSQKD